MIRKNGAVKVSKILKVRAFITQHTTKGWDQTYYMETVIIANPEHAYQVYMHELNKMKPDLFYNSDTKKQIVRFSSPTFTAMALWPTGLKTVNTYNDLNIT